jgi:hypothetical protein
MARFSAADAAFLQRCVGDPETFATQIWGRRVLVRPPDPGVDGFGDLLTLNDVDHLLTETSLRSPLFRLVKDGRPLPVGSYTRTGRIGGTAMSGLAHPARILTAFDDGATLVLQGLHRYWPPVARFCRDLELALGHPCQVNAYITPPGSRGLAVHRDSHDVFVLQCVGRKLWEVHPAPGESDDPAVGVRDVTLEPGATLYLPLDTPHAARTQNELSVHLTVGILATTWTRLLDEVVARLSDDPQLREPLPVGYPSHPDAFAELVGERLAEVTRHLDKLDRRTLAEAVTDGFFTSRPPWLAGGLLDRTRLGSLSDDTVVRRRAGSVCELRVRDGRLHVLLGDRELVMPGWLEPAMRAVADRRTFAVGDLAPLLDEESRRVLVRRLVREGLLELPADR